MNVIKRYIKPNGKYEYYVGIPSNLSDLSVSGELFNKFNIEKILENVKPSYTYKSGNYNVKNYKNDNILIKIIDKQ